MSGDETIESQISQNQSAIIINEEEDGSTEVPTTLESAVQVPRSHESTAATSASTSSIGVPFSFDKWRCSTAQAQGETESQSTSKDAQNPSCQRQAQAFPDAKPGALICKECFTSGKSYFWVSQERDGKRHEQSRNHTAPTMTLLSNFSAAAIKLVKDKEATTDHVIEQRLKTKRPVVLTLDQHNSEPAQKLLCKAPESQLKNPMDKESEQIDQLQLQQPSNFDMERLLQELPKLVASEVEKRLTYLKEVTVPESVNQQNIAGACDHVHDLEKWTALENITNLCETISDIEFFLNDVTGESVIRCKTCWEDLDTKRLSKMNAFECCRHFLSNGAGTFASGLWFDKRRTELLLLGVASVDTSFWRKTKNNLRCHLLGSSASANGKQHTQATRKAKHKAELISRNLEIAKRFTRTMILTLRSKSAGLHYEDQLTVLHLNGCDIGNRGHGRKQFNILLEAANDWINEENRKLLMSPQSATGLLPHFMGILDKATQTRSTNQAVLLATILNGERVALPIGAPIVYHLQEDNDPIASETTSSDDDDSDDSDETLTVQPDSINVAVTGGSLAQLAQLMFATIAKELQLPSKALPRYHGTSADGQYQPALFSQEIHTLSGCSEVVESHIFQLVIWDVSHLLNLGVVDVRDGKFGEAASCYLSRFINRANEFNNIMSRGKGYALLTEVATAMNVSPSVTLPFATQRFASSAIKQWNKIEASFPLYAETFRQMHDEDDDYPLQYKVLGADFVADLCSLKDIFRDVVTMMELSQSLQFNHWKIVTWGERLIQCLDEGDKTLLNQHLADIQNFKFKGTRLLEGWYLTNDDGLDQQNSKGRKKRVYNWKERTVADAIDEVSSVASALKASISARLERGTSPCSTILSKIFDFERLLVHLCGSRQEASCDASAISSKNAVRQCFNFRDYMNAGENEFRRFFNFVVSLPHIQSASQSSDSDISELIPGMHAAVHLKFKGLFEQLFWGQLAPFGISCMMRSATESTKSSTKSYEPVKGQILLSLQLECSSTMTVQPHFRVETNLGSYPNCLLDEQRLVRHIYISPEVYAVAGPACCTLIDVALNTGGSEAIAESFYGVMRSQRMLGRQKNQSLMLRTKIDWALPPTGVRVERAVAGIAEKYLQQAARPVAIDQRTIDGYLSMGAASVVQRRKNQEKARLSHLT